jgi:hypothetical protein
MIKESFFYFRHRRPSSRFLRNDNQLIIPVINTKFRIIFEILLLIEK